MKRCIMGATFGITIANILDFLVLNAEAGFPVHTRTCFVNQDITRKYRDKYVDYFSRLPVDDVYVSPLVNMFGWNKKLISALSRSYQEKNGQFAKWPGARWEFVLMGKSGRVF